VLRSLVPSLEDDRSTFDKLLRDIIIGMKKVIEKVKEVLQKPKKEEKKVQGDKDMPENKQRWTR
jgi:hypothetical protein